MRRCFAFFRLLCYVIGFVGLDKRANVKLDMGHHGLCLLREIFMVLTSRSLDRASAECIALKSSLASSPATNRILLSPPG